MSIGTAQTMIAMAKIGDNDLKRRIRLLDHGTTLSLDSGIAIYTFAVPHSPGASGFVISDNQTRVAYSGDFCLRGRRHNFSSKLLAVATKGEEPPNISC
jgi:mRNA degradation ribonuclease J1/J2